MRVDAILIECIGLEQDRAKLNEEHALTPISLTAESALQLEVKLQRQKRLLSGRADYSLWYDDHTLGTNLVIVKAKRRYAYSEGFSQCLVYMGRFSLCNSFFMGLKVLIICIL
jgi:hypothetical protein